MERRHWIMVTALAVAVFLGILHPANAGDLVTQLFTALHKIFMH